MREPRETVPVNLHESHWVRDAAPHFRTSDGEVKFACGKCVFDRGEHAPFCPKKAIPIGISHGDTNLMRGG